MILNVVNQQRARRLDRTALTRLAGFLMEQAAARNRRRAWGEVSVVLLDDPGIHAINREFLGKDKPTDVISFTYPPQPGAEVLTTGEVLVNVQRAVEEGTKRSTPDEELALYIAHGFNHLSGAQDRTAGEKQRMRTRELRWLKAATKAGFIQRLFL